MNQVIYQFLTKIPKGKVVSYKTLAKYFGTSPRAIGKIMNSNTQPNKFPCYKVIKCNGEIGGYNGGDKEKIKKLNNDGIIVEDNKVDLRYFRTIKKQK